MPYNNNNNNNKNTNNNTVNPVNMDTDGAI